MNPSEYGEMYKFEGFYWWFVARRKLVQWILRKRYPVAVDRNILDVGCGTGMNHSMLKDFGRVYSMDAADEALSFTRQRGVDLLAAGNVEQLPFSENSIDLVTALDILEHTDHDLDALRELRRVIKPGGTLLVTVPAYGFLWSEHDEALHHRRRYAAMELRNKLAITGYDLENITYFITLLFFPILLLRFWNNIFRKSVSPKSGHIVFPKLINSTLIWLLDVERFILRWINLPFGVSIVCVATKSSSFDAAQIDLRELDREYAGHAPG